MRHRGVNASIKLAHSENVKALRACCVMRRCLAIDGINCVLRQDGTGPAIGVRGSIGTMPGVLLRVVLQWRRRVFFNVRFVVGFLASIIAGVSEMRWIVKIGESLITLCSSSRAALFTLCSSTDGGECKIKSIRCRRRLRRHMPFAVAPAGCAHLVSLSVSARKCWWAVMSGS